MIKIFSGEKDKTKINKLIISNLQHIKQKERDKKG
jgi:hypothetical protein